MQMLSNSPHFILCISRIPRRTGQGIQSHNPSWCHQEDSRHGKYKALSKPFIPKKYKEKNRFQHDWPRKGDLDEETLSELRQKKLCFNCKEPSKPGHFCLVKRKICLYKKSLTTRRKHKKLLQMKSLLMLSLIVQRKNHLGRKLKNRKIPMRRRILDHRSKFLLFREPLDITPSGLVES